MSENRVNIFNLLRNEGKLVTLHVYSAREAVLDPFEKNRESIYMNALPIKALIQQIGFSALQWKYWGKIPTGSIQIIVEKKNKTLVLTANKIIYNEKSYSVYKDDSQNFQYIDRPDYCVFVLGLKND